MIAMHGDNLSSLVTLIIIYNIRMIADACISGALIKSLHLLSLRCELVRFEMLLVSTLQMKFRFSVISSTTRLMVMSLSQIMIVQVGMSVFFISLCLASFGGFDGMAAFFTYRRR